ncbi:hypothetical protein [Streptacidiphilus sp. EB129]|uniref:hypothetical protein n=1 Tax=Streptacidiphilus sp. EB129 TaxID=3156262 RepID=UPI003510FA90
MGAEWVELASAGAAAFVTTSAGAMAGDAWDQAKARMARLLGRGRDHRVAAVEIEAARVQLRAAQESGNTLARNAVELEWVRQLSEALAQDPTVAVELTTLTEELRRSERPPTTHAVFSVTGGHQGTLIQAGTVMGGINLGGAPGPQ